MIDKEILERIDSETDILALASEFVELKKKGKNYFGLSPFTEEKTPSFSVSPEKNIAKCMSTGIGGRPINFYRAIKNISFEEAAIELGTRLGIDMGKKETKADPYQNDYKILDIVSKFYQANLFRSEDGKNAYDYLIKRELSEKTIKHFNIGYASKNKDQVYQLLKDQGFDPKDMERLGLVKKREDGTYYDLFSDRIMFPITNPKGQTVGFSGRTLDKNQDVKYMNSPESEVFKKGFVLYHLYEGMNDIRKAGHVILYEGFFDVISSYQAGVKAGVATMGTALTKDQAKLIKSVTNNIIIAYDGDSAGLKATDKAIPILEAEKLKIEVLSIPEKMDPDDFIKAYGPEKYESLFGEYTTDTYQFRYQFYKKDKDLKNANDIQTFKKQVLNMIRLSDDVIKDIYIKRLARDLNVDESVIKSTKTGTKVDKKPTLPPKENENNKVLDKYENAERELIFVMLSSKEKALEIQRKLKPTDYANVNNNILRMKIDKYYQEYEEFDVDLFKNMLDEVHRTYLENQILVNDFWKNKDINNAYKAIDEHIETLKSISVSRRLNYLKQEIDKRLSEDPNNYLNVLELIKERDSLLKIKTTKSTK